VPGGRAHALPLLHLQRLFRLRPDAQKIYDLYPYGGFCEFMTAPQYALVKLPDTVTFEQAARFGYLGTSFGAMKKANAVAASPCWSMGSAARSDSARAAGLAMGMTRILGTGRNKELLDRVKALAPDRIEVHALEDGATASWAKQRTNGDGVDFMISALGPGSPAPPCSIHCRPFVGAVAPSMSARSPSPFPSTCIGSWMSRSS
jgi:Threonine dehydrogenase and related Zn-dependent dehydrogenases